MSLRVQQAFRGESGDGDELRDAHAHVARSHALCDFGDFAGAEAVARSGLTRWPGHATCRVALGRALIGQLRLDEAQAILIETAHAHPGYAAAYRWLAEAFLRAGDERRGRAFLAEATRLSPSHPAIEEMIVRETGEIVLPPARPQTDFEPTNRLDLSAHADLMHTMDDSDWRPGAVAPGLVSPSTPLDLDLGALLGPEEVTRASRPMAARPRATPSQGPSLAAMMAPPRRTPTASKPIPEEGWTAVQASRWMAPAIVMLAMALGMASAVAWRLWS